MSRDNFVTKLLYKTFIDISNNFQDNGKNWNLFYHIKGNFIPWNRIFVATVILISFFYIIYMYIQSILKLEFIISCSLNYCIFLYLNISDLVSVSVKFDSIKKSRKRKKKTFFHLYFTKSVKESDFAIPL